MNSWQETNNGLVKVFTFINFLKAIDFVNDVAKIVEAENHHPEILIHSSNQVKITLLHIVKVKLLVRITNWPIKLMKSFNLFSL